MTPFMDQEPKTIWVTGASQGIGRYLAVHFARRGWRVGILARNAAALQETREAVEAVGAACYSAPCDLRQPDAVAAYVQRAVDAGFAPDVLVNNAADTTSKPLLDTEAGEIVSIIDTNVTAVILLARLVVPHMAHSGRGMIVNLSSLAGYKPNPRQTVYSISKGGLNAVSEGLRAELAAMGVHVMNVALMGIGEGPDRYGLDRLAHRLDRAIARRESDVFLYRSSKWLMRLYGAFPALARLRT